MSIATSQLDKASKKYWDKQWQAGSLPTAIDPHAGGLRNILRRRFHALFSELFHGFGASTKSLVEIGCARSAWLPYFAKEFGFSVSGIDYSEDGCQQSEFILDREGVDGAILCADVFSPPAEVIGAFDVLISFGVMEHFQDTSGAARAFAECLKPGGMIITVIPNMVGLLGRLQRVVDKAVYDIHVPLDRETLAQAHSDAGLTVERCQYFLFLNLGVINMEIWRPGLLYSILNPSRFALSAIGCAMEGIVPLVLANAFSSPYIVCVARKP